MGRKRMPNTKLFSFMLNNDLRERTIIQADRRGTSITAIISIALSEYLEKSEKGA